MMKHKIFLFFLIVSFFASAQNNNSNKPIIIKRDNITKSFGGLTTALFLNKNQLLKNEKLEIGFQLPSNFKEKIDGFFEGTLEKQEWINPFNRHDIDITVRFYQKGKLEKSNDAFYYREFKRDTVYNNWMEDTTSFNFRVRFSPQNSGEYQAKVEIVSKNCDTIWSEFNFEVLDSFSKGFLEKGNDNRHFRYSNTKESFVGVGQVIPWSEANRGKMDEVNKPSDFVPFYEALYAMNKAGGNFTRFVASPWFMELEWEALGNYAPKLGQAWEFDRVNEVCESNELFYIFCTRLHTQLENHKDENFGLRWENNCYNDNDFHSAMIAHEPPIGINKVIEFYSNELAKDHNKNYLRYLISRWGYSNAIAGWQVMSEIDNTQNYTSDKETQIQARNWTHEMIKYIEYDLLDPHLLSVAVANPKGSSEGYYDAELLNIPEIDFIGLHSYSYEVVPPTGKIRNRNLSDRYKAINQIGLGLRYDSLTFTSFKDKLFIFDEFGQVNAVPKDWPSKDNTDPSTEYNNETGFMIKQDLWFSVMSGAAVAGLDWWNFSSDKRKSDWEKYYKGINDFFKTIDFESVNYSEMQNHDNQFFVVQRWPFSEKDINRSNKRNYSKSDLLEAYTQISSDGSQGFGWMSNRSVNWMNLIDGLPVLKKMLNGEMPYSKKYLFKPSDDDKTDKVIDVPENKYYINVKFLQPKTVYKVDFYNTLNAQIISSTELRTNSKGVLKLYAPQLNAKENPDVAYKIYLKSGGFK